MPNTTEKISYRNDICPDVKLIAELYSKAPLFRPIQDLSRLKTMFENSNIIFTAWDREKLVGILRGWTDGAFHGYICDLAVHPDYQKLGIGKELLNKASSLNRNVELILRSSKIASEYYKYIGWQKVENGWFVPRES